MIGKPVYIFYKEEFLLKIHGGFNLEEIENMTILEKEIFMNFLIEHLENQVKALKT